MSVRYEIQHTIQEVASTWARVSGPFLDGPCDHRGMTLSAQGVACCEGCGSRWESPVRTKLRYRLPDLNEEVEFSWCGTFKPSRAA